MLHELKAIKEQFQKLTDQTTEEYAVVFWCFVMVGCMHLSALFGVLP